MAFNDLNIIDVIADVVSKLQGLPAIDDDGNDYYKTVTFLHGEGLEVFDSITKASEVNIDLFPMIYLQQDIQEYKDGKTYNTRASLNVFVICPTLKEYDAESRKEIIFKPILTPIYEQFINGLISSKYIEHGKGYLYPPHKKTDSMFWGKDNRLVANGFLDVIEIRDLELTFFNNNCKK